MAITPTQRQKVAAKAVADNLVADKPLPLGKVLENSGYSEKTALTPKTVTELAGFKQALYDLGLTEGLITSSLVSDIQEKPKNRLGELKLGAELLGMVKREDDTPKAQGNTYNFLFSPETQKDVAEIEAKIKARLMESHAEQD